MCIYAGQKQAERHFGGSARCADGVDAAVFRLRERGGFKTGRLLRLRKYKWWLFLCNDQTGARDGILEQSSPAERWCDVDSGKQ